MKVGIVGIGLIGGSFAKAYAKAGHTVLACDRDTGILEFAILSGTVREELTAESISGCDLILICLYPDAAVGYLQEMAGSVSPDTMVIDCCGTKRKVVRECRRIAEEYGLTYVGGHPMAGTHHSGFKYAREDLFYGAPMVIVPPTFDDIALLDRVKRLLSPAGFGSISVCTAEEHDRMIAFTSQLAHVVSNAYIKSPTAGSHQGFSAGSYKDMTRVAWLNPEMWAELFLENSDNLIDEIDLINENLSRYKEALIRRDREKLVWLLDEGRKRKEEVDGSCAR